MLLRYARNRWKTTLIIETIHTGQDFLMQHCCGLCGFFTIASKSPRMTTQVLVTCLKRKMESFLTRMSFNWIIFAGFRLLPQDQIWNLPTKEAVAPTFA